IRDEISRSAEVKLHAAAVVPNALWDAAWLLVECFRSQRKLLICGNGGSAADAQHMASEFMNRFNSDVKRPGLPAIALTTDTSFLTSYANDVGYEGVFERQV